MLHTTVTGSRLPHRPLRAAAAACLPRNSRWLPSLHAPNPAPSTGEPARPMCAPRSAAHQASALHAAPTERPPCSDNARSPISTDDARGGEHARCARLRLFERGAARSRAPPRKLHEARLPAVHQMTCGLRNRCPVPLRIVKALLLGWRQRCTHDLASGPWCGSNAGLPAHQ